MKRIFKYIMGAICCSIILALIFPSAFLEGDAKWISQSDMGRMDISFEGDIKNGKVEVKGDDIKVYEPGWFLKENYQGTLIHFPISYFKKLYQISIVPQGYKTGEDFSLIFTFRGQDLRENNQVKPAWVKFSHIKVNGKLISNEQTVWHNNPFRYSLKNLSDFNPIQIELEIQKPLVLKNNIVWKNLMAFGGLFLLLFWFPFSQKIGKIIFSKTVKIFSLIINTDIVKVVSDGYFRIDRVYRHSFWIIFGVLCVAFGFHTIHYMWGNHDWGFLVYSRPWDERMFEGRYAVNSFKILFLNGIYLPMIYDIIAFLTLALNAVLLCVYWKLKKRIIYFVLCGLILTAQPFTLGFIYYTHMLPETFIGISFALTALLLSEKIAFEKCSFIKKILISVIAIILINLSLAMYPVIISTTAVAFIGRLLIQSLDWNGSWKNFKSCFFPFFISAVNIVFGIGLYKIIITFIFPLKSFYNTDMLPLEKLPERLWILLKRSFNQLYEYYPFSFISRPITWVFLSFTVIMVLYICFKGSIKQKIIRLLLLFGALFATQTAMIIANTYVITIRLELFGFVVFETLTAVLIFSNLRKLHNFAVIATMSVVFVSVVNDLDCLRVWKFSFDTEKMLWNRVLTRLEAQENFDINRKYRIVQIGESACCFGSNFYKNSSWLINVLLSYEAPWGLFRPHEFYYPVHFISKSYKADITNPEYKAELKRLYEAGILDKAKVWPNKNGLIVWQDIILYVTDEKVLNNYKKQLEEEYRKTKESPVEDLLETDKVLSKNNTKLF